MSIVRKGTGGHEMNRTSKELTEYQQVVRQAFKANATSEHPNYELAEVLAGEISRVGFYVTRDQRGIDEAHMLYGGF
jgi:hypothetical protein